MQQFYNSPQSFGISILTPSPLLSGELTFPYSVQLASAGGVAPYLYAVVSGALPPGITLQPNGQFTGTPTSAAAYLFGVEATDARGTSSPVAQFSLTIVTAVQISTASPLPGGNQGAAYSVTFVASGGASPYSNWSLIAGSIDPGLILNPGTGVLAGTLTAAAVYTPTFQVLDALGYPAQKTFSLTVQSTTGQTATPTFSPVAGTYATAQTVALADATVGAVIYDTIDGTIPTVTTTALLTQPSINGIAGNLWVHGGTPGGNPPFGQFGLISEQSNPQTGNGSFQVNAWNAGSLTGFTPVNPSLAQLSFAPSGTFPTTTAQAEGTKVGVYLQSVDLPQPNPTTPTPKQMITPQIIFNNQVVWTSPQSIISSTLNIAVQTASGGATPPFININHSFNYAPGGTPTTQQFTLNVMIFSLGNAAPSHITPTIDTPTNSAIVAVPLGVAQAANPSNSTYLKTIAGNYSSTVFSTLFPVTYSISYAQFVTALTAARTALGVTVVPSLVPSDYLMNEMHINAELHYQSGTADATLGWQMNNWAVVANSTSGTAVLYTAPLSVSSSTVINAIATAVGFTPSNIGTAAYTIGSVVQATQQIKFTVGMMMGSESGDQMSTSIASAKTEIAQMVATGPTLIYPTANRGYIMGAMARDLEDYTAATNQALLSAASGGPIGATGAALQTAIVTQYPGFRSLMEANFFYQQSQANGSLTAWWIVSNYYSPNGLTNAVITQDWTQPNVPKIVPKDLRNCGGSITVPNFYGSASSTTGTVSAIYGGSNGYGFGFSQANGGPSFSVATPAYWNPLCNQRTRKQLWQALGLYTLSNGTLSANPTTAAIAPGTAVHDGSGNAYIALGTTNVPIGTALTNTGFFMVNRWVGLTFNQCPEVAAIAWNDEYSYVFQGEVSGATVIVNPPSGATVAAFKAAHFDFVQNAALPSFPNTQVYDCLSFEFNGVDSETPAQASSRVNNNLGGAGLSAFRGWAFCNADTWANMWNLTAGFTNPNTGPCNAGVLGIANPPFPWGSGQINAVPANDLRTKIMVGQQVQGVADYSNIGGTNGTLTPNTQPLVTSILQQMAYTNCQMAFMELTDNTFVQPPTTPNPWTHYIFPAISAFNASTPFSTVMPTMNMYGPAILTGVANSSTSATITWAQITNQGTGLTLLILRNGSQIGSVDPLVTTSFTDTGFTSPDTYTLAMHNANGTGPQGAGMIVSTVSPIGWSGGLGALDYGGIPVFQDRMMNARGFMTTANLNNFTTLDANGWPTTNFATYLCELQNYSAQPSWTSGTYKCGFTSKNGGAETVSAVGSGTVSGKVVSGNLVTFNLTGSGAFGFQVTGTTGGVTNVFAMLPEYNTNVSYNISGTIANLFTSEFLAKAGTQTIQRALDWSNVLWDTTTGSNWSVRHTPINTKTSGNWGTNVQPTFGTQSGTEGWPVEWLIDFCNLTNTNPWYHIPVGDDGSYAAGLAGLMFNNLNSNLTCYIELGNELWNGVGTGGSYWGASATAAGFTGANAPYQYWASRLNGIATAFQAVYGASFGTRCKIVAAWQTGGNGLNIFNTLFTYWAANFGTPVGKVHALATAPYETRNNASVPGDGVNHVNVNSTVAQIESQLTANGNYIAFISLVENDALMAMHYSAAMISYEVGWEIAGETTAATNVGAAILDSGMTTVVESYLTNLLNSGLVSVNWTAWGIENQSSVLDPGYLLATNYTTFLASGSPRYNAIQSFATGAVFSRNLVSASGSTVDCINYADNNATYTGWLAAGTYPYFGRLNSFSQGPYYGTGGFLGYIINCTAPGTYALSATFTTTTTGTTNVEYGAPGRPFTNNTNGGAGFAIPNASGGLTAFIALGNVTLIAGPNYVLLGKSGTTQTGVIPQTLKFT